MNGRTRDRSALMGWPDDQIADHHRDDPAPARSERAPWHPAGVPDGEAPGTRDPQAGSWGD